MPRPPPLPNLQQLTLDAVFAQSDAYLGASPPHQQLAFYLSQAPSCIQNSVVEHVTAGYVRSCVAAAARIDAGGEDEPGGEWGDAIPDPRLCIAAAAALSRVTRLDLSGLKNVGFYPASHVAAFREELLSAFQQLPDLVALDVSTVRRPQQRTAKKARQKVQRKQQQQQGGNVLPSVGDEHLRALGRHCRSLQELNVSFNDITVKGLMGLVPREEEEVGRLGCPELSRLHLFECFVSYKEMAGVALGLKDSLTFLVKKGVN